MSDLYRQLPAVDVLIARAVPDAPRSTSVPAARFVLDAARAAIGDGATVLPDLEGALRERVELLGGRLRAVINATGVVVHTNLGRSAWSERARAAAAVAMGPCNVELDLATGKRGGRLDAIRAQLRALVGCEDALVVNNCAAAVLLALTALARDREVIVSRGQLVEIGGSFRVPDVITSGGARLVEVGTTNRTRADDFAAAVGEATGALLTVHPSNFRQIGFTEDPDRDALVAIARQHGVPFIEDLGSGALDDPPGDTGVRTAVAAGVDLVLFSGDKLLGGPQAGVVVGRGAWVERLRRHPLYRALRVDKVTLAALEATLADHLSGTAPPTPAQLVLDVGPRTEALAARLRASGLQARVVEADGRAGGGSLPERPLPSLAVRLDGWGEQEARALRTGRPAVVARLADGALWVDLRAVQPSDDSVLGDCLLAVARAGGPGSAG
jgi:L-seryl-tRNA(Ser) seleniumtransferase